MSLANVFDNEFVDDEYEYYWSPIFSPKSGSVWEMLLVVVSKALGYKIIYELAGSG